MLLSSLLLLSLSALALASPQAPRRNAPSRPSSRPSSKIRCSQTYNRKEIRDLSRQERAKLFNAIKKMNTGPRPTTYDRFTRYHLDGQNIFHGGPMFLVWHRMMLKRFEMELQKIDPSVALAYWDWSRDANRPHKSPVLSNEFVGGDTQGNCLQEGAFAGWQVAYPKSHCLQRRYANGAQGTGAFTSGTVLDAIIDQSKRYDQFRQQIESVPHSHPHTGIGGDLSGMQSPNDPIFYLHHGFVDKLWADWQAEDPARMSDYYGTNRDGTKAKLSDSLPYLGARPSDAMTVKGLCYKYVASGKGQNVPVVARLRRRSDDDDDGDDDGGDDDGDDQNDDGDNGGDDDEDDGGDDSSPKTYHHRTHGDADYDMNSPTHYGDLAQTSRDYDLPKFDRKSAECASEVLDEEIIHPDMVPTCWIKMNGYCEKTLRHIEASYKCIVKKVNKEVRKRLGCKDKKPETYTGDQAPVPDNKYQPPPTYTGDQAPDQPKDVENVSDNKYQPPPTYTGDKAPDQPSYDKGKEADNKTQPAPNYDDKKTPEQPKYDGNKNPYDGAQEASKKAAVYVPTTSGNAYGR